jgi:superfamily I DNA and/or RNA helicase
MPPRIGAFDVVVIDEASQSDLSALPALLRGKQLVVIGDEQQVSPPEDNNEKRKKELIEVLGDMPAATKDNMIPGRSIFDLFSSEFSSNKVSSIYSLPW